MTNGLFDQWRSTPTSSRPRLLVVIPTYNEAERIIPRPMPERRPKTA
jgi:hypothetical protein